MISENLQRLREELPEEVLLVAVSKTKPVEDILEAYRAGHRDFGENKVQEMVGKKDQLPADIRWHMIGHLQTNKVKYIVPFVHLIHSVDSMKLLRTVNKEAAKNNKVQDLLLEIHIAEEPSKFGFVFDDLLTLFREEEWRSLQNIRICGVMGMATFTEDHDQVRREFRYLHSCFEQLKETFFSGADHFKDISMGMSGDYRIAVEEGSTIVRIGTLIFGERNYL
jgi:pyridoxal phosphate enzyme (YggS family)